MTQLQWQTLSTTELHAKMKEVIERTYAEANMAMKDPAYVHHIHEHSKHDRGKDCGNNCKKFEDIEDKKCRTSPPGGFYHKADEEKHLATCEYEHNWKASRGSSRASSSSGHSTEEEAQHFYCGDAEFVGSCGCPDPRSELPPKKCRISPPGGFRRKADEEEHLASCPYEHNWVASRVSNRPSSPSGSESRHSRIGGGLGNSAVPPAQIATASPPPTRAPPQIGEISIPQSETYLSGSEESRGRREPSTETEDSDEIRLIFPDLFPDDPPEEVIEPDFYASTGRIHRAVTRRKSQSSAVPLAIAETPNVGVGIKEPQVCLLTAQNQNDTTAIEHYPVLAEYPKVGSVTKEPQVCLLTAQNQNDTTAIKQYPVLAEYPNVGAGTKEPQVCLLTAQNQNDTTAIEHYKVLGERLKVGAVTKEPQVCLLTAQNQKVIAAIQQYPVLAEYPKVGAETKEPQVCLLTAQNQNATAAIQQYSVFGENLKVGAVTKEPQVCLLTEQHPNANTTIEHYPVLEFSKPMAFGRGGSRGPRGTPNQPRGYSRTPNPQPPAGPASTLPPTLYEIRRKILQHRTVLRNLAQCMEDNLVVAQTRTHKAALNKFEWLEIEHFARPGTSRHIQILYHRNALEQPGTFSEPDIRQAHIDALEHLERDPAERMYSQQSGLPSETGLFGRSMHTESEMPEPKKPEPEKRDVREESYDLLGLYAKKPEDIGKRLDWVDPRRLN